MSLSLLTVVTSILCIKSLRLIDPGMVVSRLKGRASKTLVGLGRHLESVCVNGRITRNQLQQALRAFHVSLTVEVRAVVGVLFYGVHAYSYTPSHPHTHSLSHTHTHTHQDMTQLWMFMTTEQFQLKTPSNSTHGSSVHSNGSLHSNSSVHGNLTVGIDGCISGLVGSMNEDRMSHIRKVRGH